MNTLIGNITAINGNFKIIDTEGNVRVAKLNDTINHGEEILGDISNIPSNNIHIQLVNEEEIILFDKQTQVFDASLLNTAPSSASKEKLVDNEIDVDKLETEAGEENENLSSSKNNTQAQFLQRENREVDITATEIEVAEDVEKEQKNNFSNENKILLDNDEPSTGTPAFETPLEKLNEITGTDLKDKLRGTNEADLINSGDGRDKIYAKDGNDTIDAGRGNDKIFAGAGNDTITGGEGRNSISAGADNDIINITEGDGRKNYEIVRGGDGNDTVVFSGNRDDYVINYDNARGRYTVENVDTREIQYIYNDVENYQFTDGTRLSSDTNFANDTVTTGDSNDTINTGSGDDTINSGAGRDRINAGIGNDTINGGTGRNSVNAGAGDDIITITEGDGRKNYEVIRGGADNDTVVFTANRDDYVINHDDIRSRYTVENIATREIQYIYDDVENYQFLDKTLLSSDTNFANDTVNTTQNNALIKTGSGDDSINSGSGNDKIYGGLGNDIINSKEGNDRVYGGAGNDTIDAGTGRDRIYAGEGDDTIALDTNDRIMDGGEGLDTLSIIGNSAINFSALDDNISNMEIIHLSEGTQNVTSLTLNDVLNMSDDNNTIQITSDLDDQGDKVDHITLDTKSDGSGEWTLNDVETGKDYQEAVYSDGAGIDITLQISTNIIIDEY
ncbi:hypothetical protein N9X61_00310 [Sulfurimonas sp.]|nr:hypothetical protein [Sulfurimonas sp.]